MNLILFTIEETRLPLSATDPRARHLLHVLGRRKGDRFDAGLIGGPRGKGTIVAINDTALTLEFAWGEAPQPLRPLILLVGLPRPQTARDILRDATTLGATAIHFVRTARGDPNYASSTLWSTGEWRRHVAAGAEQAFDTRLPEVTWTLTLDQAAAGLPPPSTRLALDVYEGAEPLGAATLRLQDAPLSLAIGPERGWDERDRVVLRSAGFSLVDLGPRVLRCETAVVAALSIVTALERTRPG